MTWPVVFQKMVWNGLHDPFVGDSLPLFQALVIGKGQSPPRSSMGDIYVQGDPTWLAGK